jgi:hypothetical protein
LIPSGTHQQWLDLLGDQAGHGYYATRQRQREVPEQQAMSFDQAKEWERKYFDKTFPWSSVPESIRNRLGTENLVKALSDQLCDMIGTWLFISTSR